MWRRATPGMYVSMYVYICTCKICFMSVIIRIWMCMHVCKTTLMLYVCMYAFTCILCIRLRVSDVCDTRDLYVNMHIYIYIHVVYTATDVGYVRHKSLICERMHPACFEPVAQNFNFY
jgi:hypothetical protein